MAVAFPSGTRLYFVGSTASTGWTKDTTTYDHILRLTSGSWTSGGTNNFSATFTSRAFTSSAPFAPLTSGSTILTYATLPQHTHTAPNTGTGAAGYSQPGGTYPLSGAGTLATSGATGNPAPTVAGHTHPFGTIAASINGTVNMAVKYVDVIIAIKD